MTSLSSRWPAFPLLARCLMVLCLAGCSFAYGQTYYNKEVRINDLPSLTAQSTSASDVLAASAEIIFRDKDVCCGKNSALADGIRLADPTSLPAIANRLRGRNVLSDGGAFLITAEYLSPASVNIGDLMGALTEKHALLMEWNSHFYVVYGVIYDQTIDPNTGATMNAIHKLLLLDPRFSDGRRELSFDRQSDDWAKVQGLLMLKAAPQ